MPIAGKNSEAREDRSFCRWENDLRAYLPLECSENSDSMYQPSPIVIHDCAIARLGAGQPTMRRLV